MYCIMWYVITRTVTFKHYVLFYNILSTLLFFFCTELPSIHMINVKLSMKTIDIHRDKTEFETMILCPLIFWVYTSKWAIVVVL
jgi:hypothetical protein